MKVKLELDANDVPPWFTHRYLDWSHRLIKGKMVPGQPVQNSKERVREAVLCWLKQWPFNLRKGETRPTKNPKQNHPCQADGRVLANGRSKLWLPKHAAPSAPPSLYNWLQLLLRWFLSPFGTIAADPEVTWDTTRSMTSQWSGSSQETAAFEDDRRCEWLSSCHETVGLTLLCTLVWHSLTGDLLFPPERWRLCGCIMCTFWQSRPRSGGEANNWRRESFERF